MPLYQRSFVEDDEDEFNLDQEEIIEVPDNLPPEEKTYAKRYGDLRRYSQTQINKLKAQIESLTNQVTTATKSHLQLPNTEDDQALDEWMKTYPDLSRVLTRLSDRRAQQATSEFNQKLQQLEEDRKALKKQEAMQNLANAHPDFFGEIRVDEKFHEWLAAKSPRIQNIMYADDNDDWQSAADVISMYKLEKNIKPKKDNDVQREIIRDVPTRSRPSPTTSVEYSFSESQIELMSAAEYEQFEEQIEKARKEGRILRDRSAGMR